MPVEMEMWRIDGEDPKPLASAVLPDENTLEDFLAKDPSMLGDRLLVIGRQVRTPYNKYIDLLAIDADGNLHVLELKKDKTPRDVIAQVLDYGSWVRTLTRDEVIERAEAHLPQPFEAAFEAVLGQAPPDEINGDLTLTVMATNLDNSSERIVDYLREFGVPINAVFFSYIEDDGHKYLARSWHASQDDTTTKASGKKSKRAEWNGRDWYVNFGDGDQCSWEDGRRLGFISVGGGAWYSQILRALPTGARVNVTSLVRDTLRLARPSMWPPVRSGQGSGRRDVGVACRADAQRAVPARPRRGTGDRRDRRVGGPGPLDRCPTGRGGVP